MSEPLKYEAGQNLVCKVMQVVPGGYAVCILDTNLDGFLATADQFKIGDEITVQFVLSHQKRILLVCPNSGDGLAWTLGAPTSSVSASEATIEDLPDLVKHLRSDSEKLTRRSCAQIIGALGPSARAAVPDLIYALEDDLDIQVRNHSAKALGLIGPAAVAAVPALLRMLGNWSSGNCRPWAAEALGQVARRKDPEVLRALICALQDPDENVRQAASKAFGVLGNRT